MSCRQIAAHRGAAGSVSSSTAEQHRTIRSYVRREGRLTAAQQRALQTLWTAYGTPPGAGQVGLDRLFGRSAPRFLEIGFGNGEALLAMAAAHPERDYLGIEVHRPGIGHLLMELNRRGLQNVRVFQGDAIEVLEHRIGPHALAGVLLFFPDPWPKKRHRKRRLVTGRFVELLVQRLLAEGGLLHIATDWEDYAAEMLALLRARTDLRNLGESNGYASAMATRPATRFERRGRQKGHAVFDLLFETHQCAPTPPMA